MTRDESRIRLAPFEKGLANHRRIFIRAQSTSHTDVVALRNEECVVLSYIEKEQPTYFEFVRNFLLRNDAHALPISQAVTILFSLRAKGILDFAVSQEDETTPTPKGANGLVKHLQPPSKALSSWRLSLPEIGATIPAGFYKASFFVAVAALLGCGLFFWSQSSAYLRSFEQLMQNSAFLLPLILPIAVACYVMACCLRTLNAAAHGMKALFLLVRLRGSYLPTLHLEESEVLFLRRWPALSYCVFNLASPLLLAALSYSFGRRFEQAWLLCFSYVFFAMAVCQSCPLYDGAVQRLMQIASVENHLREKIYRYLTSHIFRLGGLFAKKTLPRNGDEWIPVYAGAALLWLYYVSIAMSDVVIKSGSELFSQIFFGETVLIRVAASILLAVMASFLFSTLTFLVSIPFQNLNTYMAVPLRKARRKLFDYGPRGSLNRDAITAFLRDIAIFAHLDDEALRTMGRKMYPMVTPAGKTVINQGEDGHEFFVIADGEADILVKDHLGVVHLVDILKPGDSFGEIALIKNLPRQATIKARQTLKLMVLRRTDFDLLYPVGSALRLDLTQFINSIRLLSECEAFSHLTTRQARLFVTAAKSVIFRKGETIIHQGDEPDFVYLIEQGYADVHVYQPERKTVAVLGRGQVFGMIAVLKSVPRTASVVALEDVTCLRITKEDFISICLDNLLVATVLSNLTETQMNELHVLKKVG